jgi:two-component system, chemotaxis family, sensor kinase CheA
MKISEDISQEELIVFLEETDEQIKLLDEDLVQLEKSGVKPEIMQEIFRAAHTIKGSSAMMGLENMSQVAHAMETVLDKLRSNKLEISTFRINALLSGLDMLKSIREIILSEDEGSQLDIQSVTNELEKVASNEEIQSGQINKKTTELDIDTKAKIQKAQEKGDNAYVIRIDLDKNSTWASVRLYQLVTELSQVGEIMFCNPKREDIESGRVEFALEVVLTSSIEVESIKNAIKTVSEIVSINIEQYDLAKDQAKSMSKETIVTQNRNMAEKESSPQLSKKASQTSETVRVDVRLLDNLMNLVGEMVIDRNRIVQLSRKLGLKYEDDEIVETLGDTSVHMVKLVSDLQENILRARMLHIGTILNGFPRLVRDLAQKVNKKIDLVIEGQETELDRSIIEQIRDPLLHLIRNSVDHGIETPEVRKKAGKPETGTIKLSAYHEQSNIVISISDDGAGIDVEKVKLSAVKKGYIQAEEAARLSNAEAINLIFISGLSTSEKVTEVSGRGVGMDVVKTNVSSVGGSIYIDGKYGQGTTTKIRLPLTLATIDGIMVTSGGLTYIVPISVIVEILKLKPEQIQSVMGKEVFRLRENVIPLTRLSQKFDSETSKINTTEETNIVVIKVGDRISGIVVDAVLEPQESVVKSLGKYIGSVRGISGATIMGDGQVALILDTATLISDT